jgi:ribosomal protein S12 methylthiotransferase
VRERVPDIAIRTTFIVGFPGETEDDFAELCDFVTQQRFDHVGVFTFFQESGVSASELPNQVPDDVKLARQAELMALQADLSRERLYKLIGSTRPVLIEGVAEESDLLLRGRLEIQAPDVDGQVYVTSAPADVEVGQIRDVMFTQVGDYDLVGEIVDSN